MAPAQPDFVRHHQPGGRAGGVAIEQGVNFGFDESGHGRFALRLVRQQQARHQ